MSEVELIQIPEAVALVRAAFVASGVEDSVSASVAHALVAAEAEGQSGHGFSRVADYVAQARSGKINPAARIKIHERGPASLLIDADCGFAYPAIDAALDAGLSRAQEQGVAIMAIGNSHHCGALSLHVEKVADAGLIGLMVANTPKAIAPWGAKDAYFGTNPIAFSVPRAEDAPLVMDLSLSRVARGKVMAASKAGDAIPEGWALDADGQPTTDPDAALQGTMVPIGEAKGTALALMVEILASAFTGSAFSSEATSFFAAEGAPPRVGQTIIAIKPSGDVGFADRLRHMLGEIEAMPGARLPGARRLAVRAKAREEGLLVPKHLIASVRALAGG